MDKKIKCKKGCCVLKFTTLIHTFVKKKNHSVELRESAGVAVITNTSGVGEKNGNENRKILITQSYNNLWGVPKGKKEGGETIPECASREVVEESGIKISSSCLKTCEEIIFVPNYDKNLTIHIFKYTMSPMDYIMSEMSNVNINDLHQDSTGFGWINISCLKDVIQEKKIRLNALTKFVLKKL